MSLRTIVATTLYVAAIAATGSAVRGCCTPKGQEELLLTVLDDPSSQVIGVVSFTGAVKYSVCHEYFGDNGAGGASQSSGPCAHWLVYPTDDGGQIVVSAVGYAPQTIDVPKADLEACGVADRNATTFRLVRK